MKTNRNQRKDIRFTNKFLVKMMVDTRMSYGGSTQDISQSGAFISTDGPFHVNQKIVLDFKSTRRHYKKRACNIVRIVPNGIGIQFDKPLGPEYSSLIL